MFSNGQQGEFLSEFFWIILSLSFLFIKSSRTKGQNMLFRIILTLNDLILCIEMCIDSDKM